MLVLVEREVLREIHALAVLFYRIPHLQMRNGVLDTHPAAAFALEPHIHHKIKTI